MEQLERRGAVNQIAAKLGISPEQANSAVTAAVPTILAGLAQNTRKPEGAAALEGALDRHHDGSVLEDDRYFDAYQARKGDKILGHVFGQQTPAVQSGVSAAGGLDPAKGAELMKMLAPLVMGFLAKEKSGGAIDIGSLSQILGGGGGTGGLKLPGGLGDLLGGLGSTGAAGDSPASRGAKSSPIGDVLGKFFKKK
jgi:hypothetical protein